MERLPVQILVVVANIQMRTLKAEVEKGSVRTAFGHGLFDPKAPGSSIQRVIYSMPKGSAVNIPQTGRG